MSDFKLNKPRREWLDALSATGSVRFVTDEALVVAKANGWNGIPLWFRSSGCEYKKGRGFWDISSYVNGEDAPAPAPAAPATALTISVACRQGAQVRARQPRE